MRVLKLGIISVVVLFIVVTCISLLLPSRIIISRAIDINAPPESVFKNVVDLNNWKQWYPSTDTATFLVSALHTGEGASAKIDKATIMIKKVDSTKIEVLWIEGETKKILPATFNFISNQKEGPVTLQWQFIHTVSWYPWEKFASIVSNNTIGTFMEKCLDNLKQSSEN